MALRTLCQNRGSAHTLRRVAASQPVTRSQTISQRIRYDDNNAVHTLKWRPRTLCSSHRVRRCRDSRSTSLPETELTEGAELTEVAAVTVPVAVAGVAMTDAVEAVEAEAATDRVSMDPVAVTAVVEAD